MSSNKLQKIGKKESNLPLKNATSDANNQMTTCPCIQSARSNNETVQLHEEIDIKQTNDKPITYKLYQKFLGELTGTCFLMLGSVGGPLFCEGNTVAAGLLSGFTVTAIIYMFVNISGAHFNPAVSFPLYLRKLLPFKDMLIYVLGQVIGAFIGCILIALCRKGKFDRLGATKIQDYVINLGKDQKLDAMCYVSGLFCEIVCTFLLMTFVFSINEKNNKLGNTVGIVFGLVITMLVLTAGNITAASFNPARSLAPAVLQAIAGGDTEPIKEIWIYIIGPLAGGSLAALYWSVFAL